MGANCSKCGKELELFGSFVERSELEPEGILVEGAPVCFDCLPVVQREVEQAIEVVKQKKRETGWSGDGHTHELPVASLRAGGGGSGPERVVKVRGGRPFDPSASLRAGRANRH